MKKTFYAVVVFVIATAVICSLSGAGIAEASGAKITTPESIVLVQNGENYAISWTQVVDNNGYTVEIDEEEVNTEIGVNYVNANDLSVGVVHKVRVKALATDGKTDSDYSAIVDIVKTGKLPSPSNIGVNNLQLSWDGVVDATAYKVTVNGVIIAENATDVSIDLTDKLYSTGVYLFKIKALGDNLLFFDSDYSAEYSYTHTKALAIPTNLAVTESEGVVTASWDAVAYATTYEISVDETVFEVTGCTADISEYVAEVSDHNVKVRAKAVGNFTTSEYTVEQVFSTQREISAPMITIEGGVASWTRPEGANRFAVRVRNLGGEVFSNAEFDGTTVDIATLAADDDAGEYVIQVQALGNGNYNQSDVSTATYIKYEKLSAPVLTLDGQTVSWTAVTNAVNYTVKVDGRIRNATLDGLEYDFSADVSEAKTYEITVSANANGWYTSSDAASKDYVFAGKLAQTDVSAAGLTLNWTAVTGAQTYAVTVDGEKVAGEIAALTLDLAEYCTENRTYTVGVYAEAVGNYAAADSATTEVTGEESAVGEMRTYNLKIASHNDLVYFVDGVKTSCTTGTYGTYQTVTLPSSAQKLIVVIDNSVLTAYDGDDFFNCIVYKEADLSESTLNEETGYYDFNSTIGSLTVAAFSVDSQPATAVEGYDYIEVEGNKYYYHVKPEGKIPTEIG